MALLKAESPIPRNTRSDYEKKKKFLLSNFNGKSEYVREGMIYCKQCNGQKLYDSPERNFVIRCACDCEDADWQTEREKKEREYGFREFAERRKVLHTIGRVYREASFYRIEPRIDDESNETLFRCEMFCNRFDEVLRSGKGIWLYGGIGSGKTYLAASMLHRIESAMRKCIFTHATTVFSALKSSYGQNEGIVMGVLREAEAVFIDQVDEAFMTTTESVTACKKLSEIVRMRYEDKKPTVIIGENSILDFSSKKNISESSVDVMISSMVQLRLCGKNRRAEQRKVEF